MLSEMDCQKKLGSLCDWDLNQVFWERNDLDYYDRSLVDLMSTEQSDLSLDISFPLNWMESLMDWDLNQIFRKRNEVIYYYWNWVYLMSPE